VIEFLEVKLGRARYGEHRKVRQSKIKFPNSFNIERAQLAAGDIKRYEEKEKKEEEQV
jgi:hypothetical protein